jgi:hypothetical protein
MLNGAASSFETSLEVGTFGVAEAGIGVTSSSAEHAAPTAAISGFLRKSVSPEAGPGMVTRAEQYELANPAHSGNHPGPPGGPRQPIPADCPRVVRPAD